ncbi:hypothetical protein T4B_10342 [Trichinella pseudospiralis]|uniref:Uncharacterized protein n=1 Tax=Trichinella pseudospiralis TaxID=6337 RepID=A0A0V1IV91_TRIPS|nr:hypothetical protein T4A_11965 [Trichinella pseudospiralis]KRZ26624.1 hypothetical protein T4B_10342 [Trichinella pseudospiralis]KRZ41343.1 hypothetical protein T4C_480 [Trichinella pseudospiralis]
MLIFGLYGLEDVDNILMFVVQLIGYLFNHSYFLDQLIPSSLIFDRLDQHRSFVLVRFKKFHFLATATRCYFAWIRLHTVCTGIIVTQNLRQY